MPHVKRLLIRSLLLGLAMSLLPVIARAQYPGGTRNPDEWYYCVAENYTPGSTSIDQANWSAMECLHLLWQEVPGNPGVYDSLNMDGAAFSPEGEAAFAEIRAVIIPARGIEQYTYRCTATVERCRQGTGSTSGLGGTTTGTGWTDDGTGWSWPNPGTPSVNGCIQANLDAAGMTMRSQSYDNWWTADPVVSWVAGMTNAARPGWRLGFGSSMTHSAGGFYQCRITGWESWPVWLESNDEWLPGPMDIFNPGFQWPSIEWPDGITISPTATYTIEFGVAVGDLECYTIYPGLEYSQTVVGYEIDVGFDGGELCTREYDIQGQVGDFNVIFIVLSVAIAGGVFAVYRTLRG